MEIVFEKKQNMCQNLIFFPRKSLEEEPPKKEIKKDVQGPMQIILRNNRTTQWFFGLAAFFLKKNAQTNKLPFPSIFID